MTITENKLHAWVESNERKAQGVIVELIHRLVRASCPNLEAFRFPLGDSMGQPGEDGYLNTQIGFPPYVPAGTSYWEIGTDNKPGVKATSDYTKRTNTTNATDRQQSTFVFVTPRSAAHGWSKPKQDKWIDDRKNKNEWQDIRIIDGTKLVDWMDQFPAVTRWFLGKIGERVVGIQTAEQRWTELSRIGEPPLLPAGLFLINRDEACHKLHDLLEQNFNQLKIETRFPGQVADFVAAYISTLRDEEKSKIIGRFLIVKNTDAWDELINHRDRHFLVADFDINDGDSSGTRLLSNAKAAGHAVIYSGLPSGIPTINWVSLRSPKSNQVALALVNGGYSEGLAGNLAQKSGGDINTLLRLLQNLSHSPDWSQNTVAAELAIALLLGSWSETSLADCDVVEALSGKLYGGWIGVMREIVLRPDTPLNQRNGNWKFVLRYEGWYTLGPKIYDEHLDRFQTASVAVLKEMDPQFDLEIGNRFASNIYGKVFKHSHLIRNGIAESLALLGCHPKALSSCSFNKPERVATLVVRDVLGDADWLLWASLNNVLPLLAESAPDEFLNMVENAFARNPCPFDGVFAQEGDGGFGSANYMTGLLWALETLAWDADHLTRVVICLGELAARDPGGKWSNRPINSLSAIFLPWLPQTCATVEQRFAAVKTLLEEIPVVGYKLLVSLLPNSHDSTMGTRKPTWRETIPDDWSRTITDKEYWDQTVFYSELAITVSKNDSAKLTELIEHSSGLPKTAYGSLLAHLRSDEVIAMPEEDRLPIWTALVDIVNRHRKYSDANWAMESNKIEEIANVSKLLTPSSTNLRYQRLFSKSDFELYEGKDDFEEQRMHLDDRRQKAMKEIVDSVGVQGVMDFATAVQSPRRVGLAFGIVAEKDADAVILPDALTSEKSAIVQFAEGYVWSRFQRGQWDWVDSIRAEQWTSDQAGQFLSFLPFTTGTWERSKRLLQGDESSYWSRTSAIPYQVEIFDYAIDKLIEHSRPYEAIECLLRSLDENHTFDPVRAVRALLAALEIPAGIQSSYVEYQKVEVIKALQNDPSTNPDDLFKIEWAYLPFLRHNNNAAPKLLESRLANEPEFFCEIVRLAFRSKKKEYQAASRTEDEAKIAVNAHRMLDEWRTPPGSGKDVEYDGNAFTSWLSAVKEKCTETGHLEIAMQILGSVLIYAPPDKDGLWIHRSVAAALNARDAEPMRNGFWSGLFNARGVYSVDSTGKNELVAIADKYRVEAEAAGGAGYHRLADTLNRLVRWHKKEAESIKLRDELDD